MPIQPFHTDMAIDVVQLWRNSMEKALAPFKSLHSFADQVRYLVEELHQQATVSVYVNENLIYGFMAQNGSSIEQLYVAPDAQHQGIGTEFLHQAKFQSPNELNLFTFEKNHQALNFYKKNGFQEVCRGSTDNEEGLPEVQMRWQSSKL